MVTESPGRNASHIFASFDPDGKNLDVHLEATYLISEVEWNIGVIWNGVMKIWSITRVFSHYSCYCQPLFYPIFCIILPIDDSFVLLMI